MRTFKDINGYDHNLDEYLDCYRTVYLNTAKDILTKSVTAYFINFENSFDSYSDLRIGLDKKYYDILTIELRNK